MKEIDLDFNGLDISLIDMNLKNLYYFIIVAETENITKAAKRLYVTQSMLSKNIMALEERVGIPLFDRDSRNLKLTRSGRYLYQKWKDIIILYQRDIEHAKLISSIKVERLRVGCFPLKDSVGFMEPYLKHIYVNYPETFVEIFRMNYNRLLEHLNSGQMDIVFTLETDIPDNAGYYEWQEVARVPSVAVVNRMNPLSEKRMLKIEDLAGQRLLISNPPGSLSRMEKIQKICREGPLDIRDMEFMNNDLTVFVNAEYNRGIGLGIRGVFNEENERVRLIEIGDAAVGIVTMWNRDAKEDIKDLICNTLLREI